MDPELQDSFLLAPSVETLALVKVFPLIPALKRDVTVRHCFHCCQKFVVFTFTEHNRYDYYSLSPCYLT